jgi:hypothetical protein
VDSENEKIESGEAVLPCPFCGAAPEVGGVRKLSIHGVMCVNPDCGVCPSITSRFVADAIARWNRRAAVPVEVKPLEWLQAFLQLHAYSGGRSYIIDYSVRGKFTLIVNGDHHRIICDSIEHAKVVADEHHAKWVRSLLVGSVPDAPDEPGRGGGS